MSWMEDSQTMYGFWCRKDHVEIYHRWQGAVLAGKFSPILEIIDPSILLLREHMLITFIYLFFK